MKDLENRGFEREQREKVRRLEFDILERLQSKLNVSLQIAQEYLKMFGKQTV